MERADYHEVWSKAELAEKEPLIERSRLNGAVVYPEFLTDDSRLTVATVRSAIDHGATVATYLRATNIRKEQTFSIDAASTLPGEMSELTISARAVVNAAGLGLIRCVIWSSPSHPGWRSVGVFIWCSTTRTYPSVIR